MRRGYFTVSNGDGMTTPSCKFGHIRTPENTAPNGQCKVCMRERGKRWKLANRAKYLASAKKSREKKKFLEKNPPVVVVVKTSSPIIRKRLGFDRTAHCIHDHRVCPHYYPCADERNDTGKMSQRFISLAGKCYDNNDDMITVGCRGVDPTAGNFSFSI